MSIGTTGAELEQQGDEEGMTLVELLMVLLVVGILLGIAIPTFLTAQNGSKQAVAKGQATQAIKTQKQIILTDGATSVDADKVTKLKSAEPSLDVRLSDPAQAKVRGAVYVRPATGDTLVLAAANGPDDCFWTRVTPTGATEYARGTCDDSAIATLTRGDGW